MLVASRKKAGFLMKTTQLLKLKSPSHRGERVPRYIVTVRGPVPENIAETISHLHAQAVRNLETRNETVQRCDVAAAQ